MQEMWQRGNKRCPRCSQTFTRRKHKRCPHCGLAIIKPNEFGPPLASEERVLGIVDGKLIKIYKIQNDGK